MINTAFQIGPFKFGAAPTKMLSDFLSEGDTVWRQRAANRLPERQGSTYPAGCVLDGALPSIVLREGRNDTLEVMTPNFRFGCWRRESIPLNNTKISVLYDAANEETDTFAYSVGFAIQRALAEHHEPNPLLIAMSSELLGAIFLMPNDTWVVSTLRHWLTFVGREHPFTGVLFNEVVLPNLADCRPKFGATANLLLTALDEDLRTGALASIARNHKFEALEIQEPGGDTSESKLKRTVRHMSASDLRSAWTRLRDMRSLNRFVGQESLETMLAEVIRAKAMEQDLAR